MTDEPRRVPTAADEAAFQRLFPGYTRYCPGCQAAALEARIGRDARWYAAWCPRCADPTAMPS
jgi:hypothetical protein